ncbi:hypothetical protein RBB78_17050 [Tunturiibacter empetritectus]|uniref:hypothetical protein n=1 Tax=Tunturiibacter empetritectus TaxID=3069691 RepID=UPI003D9B0615
MSLGEYVGRCGICFEEADTVALVEQEVEVAGGVGLDGVELGVVRVGGIGIRGSEEAGEEELLRAGGWCGGLGFDPGARGREAIKKRAMTPQRPARTRRRESGVFMFCWLRAVRWCSLTLNIPCVGAV